MDKLDLSNIPDNALLSWLESHMYYMPEDLAGNRQKEWCQTFVTLKCFAEARGYKVALSIAAKETM
jgi:hypothetical protein